jgi:hypothetical protein
MLVDSITWTDGDNQVFPMTGRTDFAILFEREGFFNPPVEWVTEELPLLTYCDQASTPQQSGRKIQRLIVKEREIRMKVAVFGSTEAEVRQRFRELCQAFNPHKGEGTLTVTTPDGLTRKLKARFADGLRGLETPKTFNARKFMTDYLILVAHDPYFYSDVTTSITLTKDQTLATFFPIFPLTLNTAGVFADTNITNSGDLEAYPIWKVYGAANTVININNLTTGKALRLQGTALLGDAEYLIIDTNPGQLKIQKQDGTSLWNARTSDSEMWPLVRGVNKVRIEIDSPSEFTKVELNFTTRHNTI